MTAPGLKKEIIALKRKKRAVLLVHYYQRPEVQEIADFLGDSLGLCMEASRTEADLIVFAGVHFMAESAAILCPNKTILIPRPDAGCPLADTITATELMAARRLHPEAAVVTYVNSTAEIKALSDVCCTSANALNVVRSIPEGQDILMIPDGNLARYAASKANRNIIPWKGSCPVHRALSMEEVLVKKQAYPCALFIAHPECNLEVLQLADFVGSTTALLNFVRLSEKTSFLVGTEIGILARMKKENPGKTFLPAADHLICETMKYTSLENIRDTLRDGKHVVTLEDDTRRRALLSLERMMAVSGEIIPPP